ncbi:MAG: amino acid permease [Isosphaeraceae bacterium]
MGSFFSSFFRRKNVDHLFREMQAGERLNRKLGAVSLMALGIGATIGTGLYVQTGFVANRLAGPSIILSFLLAAVGCGFAALCYSELASMVPVAGSAYTYAYATLGELVAWIIGWDLILEYALGSSAVAAGWSNYFDSVMRHTLGISIDPRLQAAPWEFDVETKAFTLKQVLMPGGQMAQAWINLPAIAITAIITLILVIGIRESAGVNTAVVLLNVGVILTVIGLGVSYINPDNYHPFLHKDHGWRGVAEGAGKMFFAYIGFDSISTNAEEARRPQRDLPIGIMGALFICTILYIGAAAVLTGVLPYDQIDVKAPMAAALHARGLTFAGTLVSLGVLAGMTSSLLVGNLSQPRILLAMSRDGLLPQGLFAAIHPRFRTPWKSTILVGVFVALGAALAPLEFLADLVSIGTLFAFVVVSAAVWIMRRTDPNAPRPFRVPWISFVSAMGILVNGSMIYFLGPDNWIRLLVWLVIGLVIYFGYSRRHSKLRAGSGKASGTG